MKTLNEFLQGKHFNNINSIEYIKNSKIKLRDKIYYLLKLKGPMSKHDVLITLGLIPTSYGTSFAQWSRQNVIVPKGGKLYPQPVEDWKEDGWHGKPTPLQPLD